MDHAGTDRVSVLRDHRVVPLVPGRPQFASTDSPWRGVVLERHTVGSIEIPQHEHASFCLHLQTRGSVGLEWWCDGRHGVEAPAAGALILLGAGTSDRPALGGNQRAADCVARRWVGRTRSASGRGGCAAVVREPVAPARRESACAADGKWPVRRSKAGRRVHCTANCWACHLPARFLRQHASVPVVMPDARGGIPLPRMRRLLEYVEANLDGDLRLEQLAAEIGVSAFHFARLFRAATKLTPHQYVLGQRVERAKMLLRVPHLSVAEVAAGAGFSSASNLVRSFRERTGATPGEWRRHA